MRILIIIVFFMELAVSSLPAQLDSLSLQWKNGNIEKIPLSLIKKFTFGRTSVDVNGSTENSTKVLSIIPNPAIDNIKVVISLLKPGLVKFIVFDINKRIVYSTSNELNSGINILSWNCMIENKYKTNPGYYFFEIQAVCEKLYGKFLIIN